MLIVLLGLYDGIFKAGDLSKCDLDGIITGAAMIVTIADVVRVFTVAPSSFGGYINFFSSDVVLVS